MHFMVRLHNDQCIVISIVMISLMHVSPKGLLLALISGSVTSGTGYVSWYAALQGLTATRAAAVQLSVPVIASFSGVVFLSEAISMRLVTASLLIIGGVGLTVLGKERMSRRQAASRQPH